MFNIQLIQTLFSRLSRREKIVFNCTVAVILGIFFWNLIESFLSKNNAQNEEIASKNKLIQLDLALLAWEEGVKKETEKYKDYFSPVASAEEEITLTLTEIENLATQAGIYIGYIRPGEVTNEGIFEKYLVNLSCEGQMPQIIAFLYSIESSKRLLTVEQYVVSPKTEGSSVAACRMTVAKIAIP
jgi:Tfp pilus assembly protein PilO